MKAALKIVLVVVPVLLVGGIVVCGIGQVRHAAARMQCGNNLKQIGMGLHNYASANQDRFPTGTIQGTDLPPDLRLGWLVEIVPYLESAPRMLLDPGKAWDDPTNCPPYYGRGQVPLEPVGQIKTFLCPRTPVPHDPDWPSPTHYLGITGEGADAAELPLSNRRAGFFGYDRKITFDDIKDGASTTIAVAEAINGGPWTAGGRFTLRGVDPNNPPCLGDGGQFSSGHRTGWGRTILVQVLFADGSIATMKSSISPSVLAALATINGGEEDINFLDT